MVGLQLSQNQKRPLPEAVSTYRYIFDGNALRNRRQACLSIKPVKPPRYQFAVRCLILLALLGGFARLTPAETVNISRRLVRFDGQPAAGARVRVLGDYGNPNDQTDFEVVAGPNGVFSADILQTTNLWVGHLLIRADGCALLCEADVTGRRHRDPPWTPERRLGAPFNITGRTTDVAGQPVVGATVFLIQAQIQSANEIPFNSTKTHTIDTPELITHSRHDGTFSLPGMDIIDQEHSVPLTAVFEAVAHNPLLVARLSLSFGADPGLPARQDIPLNFPLAPPIHITGQVINSANHRPVAGVLCFRPELFTVLTGPPPVTDATGRFALDIPGPLPNLWFQLYGNGYTESNLQTATHTNPTSDWPECQNLHIALRPLVTVSGTLLNEHGQPLDETVELTANSNAKEKINDYWDQAGYCLPGQSKVSRDGTFTAQLPACPITVELAATPGPLFSFGTGGKPLHYRLHQAVNIPADGLTGLQLHAVRTGETK